MSGQPIATYPVFAVDPRTGEITDRRIGTGNIYKVADIQAATLKFAATGHPLKLKWRSEKDRAAAFAEMHRPLPPKGLQPVDPNRSPGHALPHRPELPGAVPDLRIAPATPAGTRRIIGAHAGSGDPKGGGGETRPAPGAQSKVGRKE